MSMSLVLKRGTLADAKCDVSTGIIHFYCGTLNFLGWMQESTRLTYYRYCKLQLNFFHNNIQGILEMHLSYTKLEATTHTLKIRSQSG